MELEGSLKKLRDLKLKERLMQYINRGKTIAEITNCINEIINEEFRNDTQDLESNFPFTRLILKQFCLEEELIELLIKKGIKFIRRGEYPFFGGVLVSKRMVKDLLQN